MVEAIVFSDAHVDEQTAQRLERFLREECPKAKRVYILGDLFEFWFGSKQAGHEPYRTILEAMKELSDMKELGREPEFFFTEFGDSSINYICRFWITGGNGRAKLSARSQLIRKLKQEFDQQGIEIPFPMRTLEFKNQDAFSTAI